MYHLSLGWILSVVADDDYDDEDGAMAMVTTAETGREIICYNLS